MTPESKTLCDFVSAALDHHGNGKAQDAFETLKGRLERAEAGNAALFKMAKARGCLDLANGSSCNEQRWPDSASCLSCRIVRSMSPGAALLEELEGMRKANQNLTALVKELQQRKDDEYEEAKRDAFHAAHNAALEEAAKKMGDLAVDASTKKHQFDANGDSDARDAWFHCQTTYERAQREILALKKTGQGNG